MTATTRHAPFVGQRVYYKTDQDIAILATIVAIDTNWELGVRYYRIRLLDHGADGTELCVRSREIFPAD
jgi:hypothetical protein